MRQNKNAINTVNFVMTPKNYGNVKNVQLRSGLVSNLTIIFPVHNHWKTTANCLISILKGNISDSKEEKIIVIDDASTDETPALLTTVKKEYPNLEIITNETNVGYVPSVNKALRIVKTKYILLMNNDVFLSNGCIPTLVETFEKFPLMGMLGGLQLDKNQNELSPLKFFKRGSEATIRDHIMVSNVPENLKEASIIFVDDVHFACALTSTTVVNKVGLLDEDFGKGNYDQEDMSLRIREAGYQVAICPKAKFIHLVSVSVADDMPYFSKLLDRNREIFFKKWGEKLRNKLI